MKRPDIDIPEEYLRWAVTIALPFACTGSLMMGLFLSVAEVTWGVDHPYLVLLADTLLVVMMVAFILAPLVLMVGIFLDNGDDDPDEDFLQEWASVWFLYGFQVTNTDFNAAVDYDQETVNARFQAVWSRVNGDDDTTEPDT